MTSGHWALSSLTLRRDVIHGSPQPQTIPHSKHIFAVQTHSSQASSRSLQRLTKFSLACLMSTTGAGHLFVTFDGPFARSHHFILTALSSREAWHVAPGSLEWTSIPILRKIQIPLCHVHPHPSPKSLRPAGAKTPPPTSSLLVQVSQYVLKSRHTTIFLGQTAHLAVQHGHMNPQFRRLPPRLPPNLSPVLKIRICSMDLEHLQKHQFNLLCLLFLLHQTAQRSHSALRPQCRIANLSPSTPTSRSRVFMITIQVSIAFPKTRRLCKQLLNMIRTRRCFT